MMEKQEDKRSLYALLLTTLRARLMIQPAASWSNATVESNKYNSGNDSMQPSTCSEPESSAVAVRPMSRMHAHMLASASVSRTTRCALSLRFSHCQRWFFWCGTCKHLGPLDIFRWLMTIIIVTNEFVQLNESLLLIWSYGKEAPKFHYSKMRFRYSTQIYIKTKDLSSPKCRKVEKNT